MRWFRNNARTGSWFALLALTINLALSFGHLHLNGLGANSLGADQASPQLVAAISHGAGQPADQQGHHPDDLCPICIAAAAMATAVTSAPPALPTDFTFAALDQTVERQLSVPQSLRLAFRSRGPPLS